MVNKIVNKMKNIVRGWLKRKTENKKMWKYRKKMSLEVDSEALDKKKKRNVE